MEKELIKMNNEIMDLSEAGRIKEVKLEEANKIICEDQNRLRRERDALSEEVESLKKILTTQKIELEKGKEILNREKKLAALKISDLQEQLDERFVNNV